MSTISFKTFNSIAAVIIAIMLAFIFSITLSSCEKKDIPTTTATLRTKEVVLSPTTGNTQAGKAVIAENADHSFNVSITLQNTVKDSVMVMHIHNGSITSPGNIAIPLSNLSGTGAQAVGNTLNIVTVNSTSNTAIPITYDNIIGYAGYFDIHYSAKQIAKVVANGNIK